MTTKYLAAVDTYERGFVYDTDYDELFSVKSFAKRFDSFAEALAATLLLKKNLKEANYTRLAPVLMMLIDGHEVKTIIPSDSVQSPAHYQLADGLEAIDVIDQTVEDPASFYRGNAIKYLLRAGRKGDAHEDLRKARYYIDRELSNE